MKLCVFIYTVEWKPSRWWFNAFPSPQKVLLCYFLSIPSRSNPYCYFYSQWLVLHVFKYVWNFHFTFINSVAVVVAAQSLYHVWLFVTPWTVAHQAPLSVGFPRQEYWSGLPFSFLQELFLTQGLNPPLLLWQEDSLPLSHQGGPQEII